MQQKTIRTGLIILMVIFVASSTWGAVDTRDKRASVLNTATPHGRIMPNPDSSISSGDRQQMAYCYRTLGGLTKDLSDTIALADSISNKPGCIFADGITLADLITRFPGKGLSDNVALADSTSKATGQSIADTLGITDSIQKSPNMNKSDNVAFADVIANRPNKGFSDSLVLQDSFDKVSAFYKTFGDNLNLSDSRALQVLIQIADTIAFVDDMNAQIIIAKLLEDTLNLADAISSKLIGKGLADSVGFSDSNVKASDKIVADIIAFSDSSQKGIGKYPSDGISLSDAVSKLTGKGLSDSIAFTDEFNKTSAFYKLVEDNLALSDSYSMQIAMLFADALSLADEATPLLNGGAIYWEKLLEDTIVLADSISKGAGKILSESIALTDFYYKAISKTTADTVAFSDSYSMQIILNLMDTLTLIDSYSRTVMFYRTLSDILTLTDNFSSSLGLLEILLGSEVPPRLFEIEVLERGYKIFTANWGKFNWAFRHWGVDDILQLKDVWPRKFESEVPKKR